MTERSDSSIPSDAVASRCSHGWEEPMAIAARYHELKIVKLETPYCKTCGWLTLFIEEKDGADKKQRYK